MSEPNTTSVSRRSYLKGTGAVGGATVGLAGCLGGGGGGGDGPITIGGLIPLGGPFAAFGQPYASGAQFAIDRINADGGVLGRDLELDSIDIKSDPNEAISAYEELAGSGVSAMIGPVSSGVSIQLGPTANELQVPVLLQFANSRDALDPNLRYQFRAQTAPGRSEWAFIAKIVEEQGWERIGCIFADYAYGHGQKSGFDEFVAPMDGVEVFTPIAPVSESDFTSYLRQMPDDLDLLASIGHPPGAATIVSQSFEIGLDPTNVLGALVPDTWWWGSIGENSTQGLLELRGFDPESSDYLDVATAYREENGEYFDSFHANGYVAIDVLSQAIENADSADPVAIRDAMANNSYETMYVWDLDWTDFGEHTQWTQAVIEYETGSYEAAPEQDFHPVTVQIPDTVNPSEIENYGE